VALQLVVLRAGASKLGCAPVSQDDLAIQQQWFINGRHYSRTLEDWLKRMDAQKQHIIPLFEVAAVLVAVNLSCHLHVVAVSSPLRRHRRRHTASPTLSNGGCDGECSIWRAQSCLRSEAAASGAWVIMCFRIEGQRKDEFWWGPTLYVVDRELLCDSVREPFNDRICHLSTSRLSNENVVKYRYWYALMLSLFDQR
jgi:hypothetical protein